jgi:ribosomal protein S18 acetylase RimI-like enzyme
VIPIDASAVLHPANLRDLPEIMAMMTDFHSDDRLPWHPGEVQRTICELLANEAFGTFWLIDLDGQSIGFLVLTFGFSLEFHGRVAFIDEFYIRPEFRGQGIGARALHQMVGYCARHGVRTVHLEVEHSNPRVRRLYEREGFQDRGFYILSKWITPAVPDNR